MCPGSIRLAMPTGKVLLTRNLSRNRREPPRPATAFRAAATRRVSRDATCRPLLHLLATIDREAALDMTRNPQPKVRGRDPVVHHAPADAEALGDGQFRQAFIEQML